MINTIKPTLVVLAAGMGSRYGGLKQLDSFTPQGDSIIDFSIYDAIRVGFGKIVFIIRKSFEKEFKANFNNKLKGKAEVVYVYQELDDVPEKYLQSERTKPWGTGHALLMAKKVVKENFAIINGDDFYGRAAFKLMEKSLREIDKNSYNFKAVGYLLKNTLSDHGFVSRGECKVDKDRYLKEVTERTHIEKINGKIIRKAKDGEMISMNGNTIVSMNLWGFTPKCFEYAESLFETFLEVNKEDLNAEFYLPSIVNEIINSEKGSVKVLNSEEKWFGVTYKKDKIIVQKAIVDLKEQGVYPRKLL